MLLLRLDYKSITPTNISGVYSVDSSFSYWYIDSALNLLNMLEWSGRVIVQKHTMTITYIEYKNVHTKVVLLPVVKNYT